MIAEAENEIVIEKVGLESFVYNASQKSPMLYGICAVLIALGTGLLVGFLFKGAAH